MAERRSVIRYTGSALAICGLLLATTFIGVRTTDPVAGAYIDLTGWRQVAGFLAGLLVFGVGLGVARLTMPEAEKRS